MPDDDVPAKKTSARKATKKVAAKQSEGTNAPTKRPPGEDNGVQRAAGGAPDERPTPDPIDERRSRERLRALLQRKNHGSAPGPARNWIRS